MKSYKTSQNDGRERDILALTSDLHRAQLPLADKHDVYLEVQRGGRDPQNALQNSRISARQLVRHADAADLIKVYGAGWLN